MLTFLLVGGPDSDRIPKCSQPYQNLWIINVIQDVYFAGGVASFAMCFDRFFLCHHDSQGVTKVKVPMPMVALVATMVRFFHLILLHQCLLGM